MSFDVIRKHLSAGMKSSMYTHLHVHIYTLHKSPRGREGGMAGGSNVMTFQSNSGCEEGSCTG